MAHAYICQSYDIDTIILYFDDISHQENRALVEKLAIDMVRYTEKLDLTNYQGLAIVDSQLFTVPAPLDELPVISIVDHHKLQPETQADLDVREDSGSTCSIYAEYLAEVGPALERTLSAASWRVRFSTASVPTPMTTYEHAKLITVPRRSSRLMPTTNSCFPSRCRVSHLERWRLLSGPTQIRSSLTPS